MSYLQKKLYQSFSNHKDLKAISVRNKEYSYKELLNFCYAFETALSDHAPDRVAILGDRSITSYVGVAYSLFSGTTYVPINPSFPDKQNRNIIQLSDCNTIIFDITSWQTILPIISKIEEPLTLLTFEYEDNFESQISKIKQDLENSIHTLCIASPDNKNEASLSEIAENDLLYILFTSGTTGTPKGVPISHSNVEHYLEGLSDILHLSSDDRFTQVFDLTFDLSMHDIFLSWSVGGCLCIPARMELIAPKKYIEREQISVWFSVPSAVAIMKQMNLLEPGNYPKIRYGLFCGEALPASLAKAWLEAAPNSQVINLYGPTEATIAFTQYEYKNASQTNYINGVVPIGWPFGNNKAMVCDDNLEPVSKGEKGELCLSGEQITPGYLNNEEMNKARFFIDQKTNAKWYRTGDLVFFSDEDGYIYLDRLDNQVQILGYRVELAEIENVLRTLSGSEHVAAIPWPISDGCAQGIVSFIVKPAIPTDMIKEKCKLELPHYKLPSSIHILDIMPLNSNGKIDRNKLKQYLMENK